jgi:hypothetical protein
MAETTPPTGRYTKDDFTLKEWERKLEEEEARWRHLGIALDQLNYAGSEHFAVQAKLQALINIILEDTVSEEAMNLNLKMIVVETMENIRTAIEPQIQQARLTQGVVPPRVIMPWETKRKDNGN